MTRKAGEFQNKGTKSLRIYELAKEGKTRKEIAAIVGGRVGTVGVLLWKIRNPEAANVNERKKRIADPVSTVRL